MKTKDKMHLKNLSALELKAELRQAREKQFTLSFKHATTPLTNPLEMRTLRRKIAMLETFLREKDSQAAGAKK
ncbi:MAG: 50S ribosomal protein L29 [Elusimicrobiales bacterium]|nr:50S ribosomal protein L29 [Elusimicrobiales bacterium]